MGYITRQSTLAVIVGHCCYTYHRYHRHHRYHTYHRYHRYHRHHRYHRYRVTTYLRAVTNPMTRTHVAIKNARTVVIAKNRPPAGTLLMLYNNGDINFHHRRSQGVQGCSDAFQAFFSLCGLKILLLQALCTKCTRISMFTRKS